MYYVYILQSINTPDHYYVGLTNDVTRRLEEHNKGLSIHSNKYKPWKLLTTITFEDKIKAEKFESYLKSGSGRAFCHKHF